jgi:protein-disulfide isomerase
VSKQFWAILIAIIIIVGGVLIFTGKSSGNGTPSNHVEGSASSGVKLIEYGDYECPYCGQFYPYVKQAVAANMDKIQFQFINLPLTTAHKNAFAGARAAEAAALQGKFWQMHDKLYETQDVNGTSGWVASNDAFDQYFVGYAQELGLNVNQFKTDFASAKVNGTINADVNKFKKLKLDESTPTFLLDGKQIHPGYNVADFQKALDAELAAKGKK